MPRSKSSTTSSASSFWDHPISSIEEALSLRKQIEKLQAQLSRTLGSTTTTISNAVTGHAKGGRTMSPATLAKTRAAQQKRWAEIKGRKAGNSSKVAAGAGPASSASKKKRGGGMTPEKRAQIAAAVKAHWAAKKKGGASASSGSAAGSKPTTSAAPKKKGQLTPEGRAKLAAAMKARWAAKKKAGAAPNEPAK